MHELTAISTALSRSEFGKKLCQMPDDIFKNHNNLILFTAIKELYEKYDEIDPSMLQKHLDIKGKTLEHGHFGTVLSTNISLNPQGLLDKLDEKFRAEGMQKALVCKYNEVKAGDLSIDDFVESMVQLKIRDDNSFSGDLSEYYEQSLDEVFPLGQFIKTGLPEVDEAVMGMGKGQLITIAGTPGSGKSTLAFQLALQFNSAFFSLEMSRQQLYAKYLSSKANVQTFQIYKKQFTDEEFKRVIHAQKESKDLNIRVYEFKSNLYFLLNAIKDEVLNNGKEVAFIDYVQLITDAPGFNTNSQLEYTTRALKLLAGELKIPIVILSQLTKDVVKENRQPTSGDLRNSGSMHQDSDMVLFTWENDQGSVITVDKCREGRCGSIETIRFNKPYSKFESMLKNKKVESYDSYTTQY